MANVKQSPSRKEPKRVETVYEAAKALRLAHERLQEISNAALFGNSLHLILISETGINNPHHILWKLATDTNLDVAAALAKLARIRDLIEACDCQKHIQKEKDDE